MIYRKMYAFFIILLFCSLPLLAAELYYDQSTGKLFWHSLTQTDTSNPNSYKNGSTRYWNSDQFVGRLAYEGPATTITFTNSGIPATGGSASLDRFYFTYMTDGVSIPTRWRQYFLVATVRGSYQDGSHVDHSETEGSYGKDNRIILSSPFSFPLPGAGSDQNVQVGEYGYNTAGKRGILGTKGNSRYYTYNYQYKLVWLDLTIIRMAPYPNPLPSGFYESIVTATTGNNLTQILQLGGANNPVGGIHEYKFNVINVGPSPIPFDTLSSRNNVQNSLKVGRLEYLSSDDAVELEISSSSSGLANDFQLYSDGISFPYKVAFTSTKPANTIRAINQIGIKFPSIAIDTYSAIDNQYHYQHIIEGDISIYLDPSVPTPVGGTYSSTIYCILTQTN